MSNRYETAYRNSIDDPERFWGKIAGECHWFNKWSQVLDRSREPFYRWFPGGKMNTCYSALDLHVDEGRGDQTALIYDSPMADVVRECTYRELRDEVAKAAGALAAMGVNKGDRVIIYMPMVPTAIVAMLACARIGAVHSVVFGGFAAKELATRIDDAKPKGIIAGSCGLEPNKVVPYKELLDEAIQIAEYKPEFCFIHQRSIHPGALIEGRDHDWARAVAEAEPHACVPVDATDPLYILYTSGTTGVPKGVVRDNGGHMVALRWSMKAIYDTDVGDVFWAASDIGWVVGHSYVVYGPLLRGCTTVLYEGKPVGTPDPGAFWRVVSQHNVKTLFTAPTAFRAIKREDPRGEFVKKYDLSCLKTLFLAGERLDPDTLHWAEEQLGIPVIDHWWQTETGWPITANCLGLHKYPVKPGSATMPVPGWQLQILDTGGEQVAAGENGAIVAKLPLPPGAFTTLWKHDDRFVESYLAEYPGFYQTADAGFIDKDGYVFVMGRTDDIINIAGHRLSTGGIEEVLAGHPDVAECAVLGVHDTLKGQVPLGFLVLKSGVSRSHAEISREVFDLVNERIGHLASFKKALVVERLPKTRSGKILRGTMRKIADGKPFKIPPTIDDPAILYEIREALAGAGYGGTRFEAQLTPSEEYIG